MVMDKGWKRAANIISSSVVATIIIITSIRDLVIEDDRPVLSLPYNMDH